MSKVIFMFPGQGNQNNKMLVPLRSYQIPEAMETFKEVSDVCGFDVIDLIENKSQEVLNCTKYTQLIIFATDMAYFRALKAMDIVPDVVAGHSIGEYAAFTAAGILDFHEACHLIKERARLMNEIPVSGGLCALRSNNIDLEIINKVCSRIEKEGEILAPALFNSPKQIIFGGTEKALQRLCEEMNAFPNVFIKRLAVGQAFHTALLYPMVDEFSSLVSAIKIDSPEFPILLNCTGQYYGGEGCEDDIRKELIDQCFRPVMWSDIVNKRISLESPNFVEVGPGHSLTSQLKSYAISGKRYI